MNKTKVKITPLFSGCWGLDSVLTSNELYLISSVECKPYKSDAGLFKLTQMNLELRRMIYCVLCVVHEKIFIAVLYMKKYSRLH